MKNNLQLPLTRQWFEMTKSGIKTEDYREVTAYWACRFLLYKGKERNQKFWKILDGATKDYWDRCVISSINSGLITIKHFETNILTLGYPKADDESRILRYKHEGIEIRTGNPEWGAEPNKLYFVIKHGERI